MTYVPAPHTSQHWQVTKPAARGTRGIVACQSRAAAEVGIAILEAGGNAADAATAMAFALASQEPWNSGLGGIGFALVAGPDLPAETIDFGPVAPATLDPARFPLTGRMKQDLFAWPEVEGDRNIHGPLSCLIPSAVAGYALLHEAHGRLPIADILAPAIALARRGLPADWFTTLKVANAAATLRLYPESARIYLPGGLPPVAPYQGVPGFLAQGNLATTLARLAEAGLGDFYRGDVAASIAADLAAMGGFVSASDLAGCTARRLPAVTMPWRGRMLHLSNGLTATPTFRRVAAAMEAADWSGRAPGTAWHMAFAAAMQAAYAERLAGVGDAEPAGADSCTTHLTVCDAAGMMVSMTTTLLSSMGSRLVLPGSGVLMNNGNMWFDPRPGSANAMAPGKRPLTNMSPLIATDMAGRPVMALGASGGRRILAAVFQMLAMVGGFGMDPAEAAAAPRLDVSGPEGVTADRRLPPETLAALAAAGPLDLVEHGVLPVNFACPNLIAAAPDGRRVGITDTMSPWSAALAQ